MTHKLILKLYSGPEIAAVTQAQDGKLQVQVFSPELEAHINHLVKKESQKPLQLMGGSATAKDNQKIYVTMSRMVEPGNPDYLRALADAITKSGEKIQGKRVRAYVMNDEK
jgi:hypothetical protein